MKVLIDGSKIISIGNSDYQTTGTQELKTVPNSVFDGTPKRLLKWDGSTVVKKTSLDILGENKAIRMSEVDAKTQQLIFNGVTHDSNTFSMSLTAQGNWNTIKTMSDAGSVVYPMNVTTKDNGEYTFSLKADFDAFADAAYAFAKGYVDSGRALKISITNASDQSELDAILDNRS